MWYIQAMEYYFKLKRNELSHHEKTWRRPKWILPSERSQPEKSPYYATPTIEHSGKGKTMETVEMIMGCGEKGVNSQSTEHF